MSVSVRDIVFGGSPTTTFRLRIITDRGDVRQLILSDLRTNIPTIPSPGAKLRISVSILVLAMRLCVCSLRLCSC